MRIKQDGLSIARKRVKQLRKEIERHNYLYYQKSAPVISDHEFDSLLSELKSIERDFPDLAVDSSPTNVVGGKPSSRFAPVEHRIPMLSIASDTSYTSSAALVFDEDVRKQLKDAVASETIEYCAEPKFDGLAISLRYERGRLTLAASRGDGYKGDDLTASISKIPAIPKELQSTKDEVLEVRGEVLFQLNDFELLNVDLTLRGKEPLKNPRNGASGLVRMLQPSPDLERLSFFAYGIGEYSGQELLTSQSSTLKYLQILGMPISELCQVVQGAAGLVEYYEKVLQQRNSLPYEIDGVVYKVNDQELQRSLGFRARDPRWALAHKFPPANAVTKLESVSFEVGRTGVLTPVAWLSAVRVGGVSVKRSTLHNFDRIQSLGIQINDRVVVQRAGDVIPEIVRLDAPAPPDERRAIQVPASCPSCGSPVLREEGKAAFRCTGGLVCRAQARRAVEHFVGRKAMDIEGVGEQIIGVLFEEVGLTTIAGLYELPKLVAAWLSSRLAERKLSEVVSSSTKESPQFGLVFEQISRDNLFKEAIVSDLVELWGKEGSLRDECELIMVSMIPKSPQRGHREGKRPQVGIQIAQKILLQIEQSKRRPLSRFLFALGIEQVGEENAKVFAKYFLSWQRLRGFEWGSVQLAKEKTSPFGPGIGVQTIASISAFFQAPGNKSLLERLKELGVNPADEPPDSFSSETSNLPLAGSIFLFTGKFSRPRASLEESAKLLGARIANGVSRNLTYLVVGEEPGGKLSKANDLGITLLSEEEFLALVSRSGTSIAQEV